ncbi:MAG: type II secretion system protein [Bdellovibrionales bacterium]|nr:type II secretion system protein [Bdellovibrionales bacterium]
MKRPKAGFSLVEVMVVLGIISIAFVFIMGLIEMVNSERQRTIVITTLESLRNRTAQYMIRNDSRKKTLESGANFVQLCAPAVLPCTVEYEGSFKLVDALGNTVVDSNIATTGFNINGEACNTFDAINGNDACPIRLELRWKGPCKPTDANVIPATACPSPILFLSGDFVFKPKSNKFGTFNMKRFHFSELDFGAESPDVTCYRLGGTWYPPAVPGARGRCALPSDSIEWI